LLRKRWGTGKKGKTIGKKEKNEKIYTESGKIE
jgi:hypothetical protein